MLKKASLLLVVVPLLFAFAYLNADQDSLPTKINDALKKYVEEFPQEKIYLHTDHPYYLAGETLWFKAYATAGSYHQSSPISKTLYVELINHKKEKIHQSIIRLDDGVGHGDILLPHNIPSGNYLLRGYTNWMRNFGEDFFFNKEVKIWNIDEKDQMKSLREEKAIDLQFFPEGGNLVAGIKSNIAFKAVGADGLGKSVKGKILSGAGVLITEFKTTHVGMGVVSMLPQKGESYVAVIEEEPAKKYTLPSVHEYGFVTTITNKPEMQDVVVKIQSNEGTPGRQQITLAAHSRGVIGFIAQANLTSNLFIAKIPKSKLSNGLSHITLFDATGLPQCSRLVFIDKDERVEVKLNGLAKSYKPREKVDFEIETRNALGQPVASSLSLSVTSDQEILLNNNDDNIYNYLWLTSDLKGHIEAPGYYFDKANPDRLNALDLLLLTQGWTRFRWEEILNERWPEAKHYIEQGINLQGMLIDNLTKKPIEGGKVTYLPTNNPTDIKVVATGNNGRFILDDLVFYDSSSVALQGENKKGKKFVEFKLDEILPKVDCGLTINPLFVDLTDFEKQMIAKGVQRREIDLAYNFDGKTIILDGVEVKSTKIDASVAETRMYGGAGKTIKASQVPGSGTLVHPLELLRGVPGVRLLPNPPGYSVIIRGTGSISSGTDPYILLDNVPVSLATLNSIPANNIESVDVYRGAEAAIFGSAGGNGAIAFFTKKGGSGAGIQQGVFSFNLTGYTTPQEFYSPKYDVQRAEHVKPDRRATVFWEPNIRTDDTGKAKVSFYNPDPDGEFTVAIEGLTKTGLTAQSKFKYLIRPN